MKRNKTLLVLLDIIGYLLLFFFFLFLFNFLFTIDYSVSSISPSLRTAKDLFILRVRKALVIPFSLFLTSTLDFLAVKKLLIKLKIDRCGKVIFMSCVVLSFILLISLIILYNLFPL